MLQNREALNLAGAFVAGGLICILGFVTWALVYRAVPEANQNTLTLLIGNLTGLVGLVVGFFFGSSATNKKQAETIDTLAKANNNAGAPLDPASIVLKEGQSATATATPAGTVIETQPKETP